MNRELTKTDFTLDPAAKSWIETAQGSDFPVQNLPYGVFEIPNNKNNGSSASARIGIAIGDRIVDLAELERARLLRVPGVSAAQLERDCLNDFISLGSSIHRLVRERVFALLVEGTRASDELRSNPDHCRAVLVARGDARMLMPVRAGDFVDFYSSLEHATNVGVMFRDPTQPLLPNWKHIPIGYHGRSSSLYVSGKPIIRPCGQLKPDDNPLVFAPSKQMDFELELGFVVGKNTRPGERVDARKAGEYMFGMVIVNDWSARDIQRWEYVPLGPFLGKSFATSVSAWVVPMDVIEGLRVAEPDRDVEILSYLEDGGNKSLDISLNVSIQSAKMTAPQEICRTNFRHMYWTINQQLAHMTSNGTPIRCGDLYASGTVSGKTPDSFGSMLELCWKGTRPLSLSDGSTRTFIQDGDTVTMAASAVLGGGVRIGFGECSSRVNPAIE
jgi:fumarylacetoacetase